MSKLGIFFAEVVIFLVGGFGLLCAAERPPDAVRDFRDTATAGRAAEDAKGIIVARVNTGIIDVGMLTGAMNRIAPRYVKEGEPASPDVTAKIRSEALRKLIFEELAVQEAKKKGIHPEQQAVDRVLSEVRKNLGTDEAYKEYLKKNNLTEDALKALIERGQRLELITAQEVYSKVKVDEKLLKEEYEKEKGKYFLPENLLVEDVWFVKGKDAAAREHAGEVLNTLRKKNYDTRKLVLDGTFIVRKINIKREKYPEIYRVASGIEVGSPSGIVDENDGFHIIRVLKKEAARIATFEEARPSLEPKMAYPAQEQRRQEWEQELKQKAQIEILPEAAAIPVSSPGAAQ